MVRSSVRDCAFEVSTHMACSRRRDWWYPTRPWHRSVVKATLKSSDATRPASHPSTRHARPVLVGCVAQFPRTRFRCFELHAYGGELLEILGPARSSFQAWVIQIACRRRLRALVETTRSATFEQTLGSCSAIKLTKVAGEPCPSRCRDQGDERKWSRQRLLRPRKVEPSKVRVDAPRVAQASPEVKALW